MFSTFARLFVRQICRTNVGSVLNSSATSSKALKKVQSLLNENRIKFELNTENFCRLLFDSSSVPEKVGSCRNRFNTSSDFCSGKHSLDTGRMNVGQTTV